MHSCPRISPSCHPWTVTEGLKSKKPLGLATRLCPVFASSYELWDRPSFASKCPNSTWSCTLGRNLSQCELEGQFDHCSHWDSSIHPGPAQCHPLSSASTFQAPDCEKPLLVKRLFSQLEIFYNYLKSRMSLCSPEDVTDLR